MSKITKRISPEIADLHAQLYSTLSTPLRIRIIYELAERTMSVGEMAAALEASLSTTSRHLKVLRELGLLRSIRRGQSIEYRLNDYRVVEALNLLAQVLHDNLAHTARIVNPD
jgi:DNA-binding transcriptional ArsR family regulator